MRGGLGGKSCVNLSIGGSDGSIPGAVFTEVGMLNFRGESEMKIGGMGIKQ